ncbi:MAG: DUF2130 domain-containing protein [Epsilonproteobacteria bacterium]|nr:DUF2130 domain-containing protein [Campylobacterota bacterium]
MSTSTTIKCPNCNEIIDVNEILYHQLESELKQKSIAKEKKLKQEYEEAFESLKTKQEQFDEELKKAIQIQLKVQKEKLQESIKKELQAQQDESIKLLKRELDEKSNQVKELHITKIEIEKLKRQKDEIESKVKAQAELSLTKRLQEEKELIQKKADEQNELKFRQKEEQLKQLQEQLQIAQRKAEQSSMQLQGEVQELAIEEYLSDRFPFDTITEIKKGARGADCIEVVHTREHQNCGKIYYESKRTKDFQKSWIAKFKADMIEKGVDVGVLVTQALPQELDRMGLVDGVWICTFEEFKGLSAVLRESIIKIYHAKKTQENKTDKMSLLYDYLTSNEFSMQIEAIVEGFTTMKNDLESEKRAMARIWKQRDKQIDKVLDNTIGMYGSIKGIAGNAIGNVKALELPYSDE